MNCFSFNSESCSYDSVSDKGNLEEKDLFGSEFQGSRRGTAWGSRSHCNYSWKAGGGSFSSGFLHQRSQEWKPGQWCCPHVRSVSPPHLTVDQVPTSQSRSEANLSSTSPVGVIEALCLGYSRPCQSKLTSGGFRRQTEETGNKLNQWCFKAVTLQCYSSCCGDPQS